MKLTVEVNVPPKLLVPTEVLVALIGAEKVAELVQSGVAVAGQKRWDKRRRSARTEELSRSLTEDEEAQLKTLEIEIERGLTADAQLG